MCVTAVCVTAVCERHRCDGAEDRKLLAPLAREIDFESTMVCVTATRASPLRVDPPRVTNRRMQPPQERSLMLKYLVRCRSNASLDVGGVGSGGRGFLRIRIPTLSVPRCECMLHGGHL